jgi:uroporphyrinogen decarboxylase
LAGESEIAAGQLKPLLKVLAGGCAGRPPIWLMRQAGRYLPEYREIRARCDTFLDFCYTPRLAAEATLQPIRRFGFDGAILFSDILVVPDALGQKVSFETGAGPRLDALQTPEDFGRLRDELDMGRLAPVFETVERVKGSLPRETTLIGFCGAPWTVASYMIAGRGTPDQAPARLFAYRHPEAFDLLIQRLVDSSVAYLLGQVEAGVEALQLFDSWAGVLPTEEFRRWVAGPLSQIVAGVKAARPEIPIIVFARGVGSHLIELQKLTGAEAYGLDTAVDPEWAVGESRKGPTLQGNLDPLALIAGGHALEKEAERILRALKGHPHIFNLGHGILPETPIPHVERLLKIVRGT